MKALLLMYRIFGRKGFLLLLAPVMGYYYLFHKQARLASQEYLQQIKPLLSPAQQDSLSTFRHFMQFGEILLDKLLVWMGHIRKEDVFFESPDIVSEIETSGKGGIIVVSHQGNFEVCSALANQLPHLRLTILVYTQHAEKFMFSERINTGGYIVIAGDRTPVSGKRWVSRVNFLRRQSAMPQGAFILGNLLKCPMFLMFCLKQNGRYHIYLEKFSDRLTFANRKDRSKNLNRVVQQYAERLEHYCLLAPLQWFNFFPYWENTNEESAAQLMAGDSESDVSPGK